MSLDFEESSLGPSSIGRYRILRELGHGAFGRVYQALDETLNRHVAIKLLTKFDDVNQLEGWLSEARVLAGLDHPSIVPIFDVGRTELGQPYIVSKLIEGELERTCLKMLSKKVSDRYTTAGDLTEELQYWDSSSTHLQSKASIAIEPTSTYVASDLVQPIEPQSTVDQFEQWLNVHREEQLTDFHESLRQCDGVNVQAILLVRDDFMVGLSSFLEQVEEHLLQNQNFATVEPFGVSHAQKVLAAFGRAYGAVKDPPTPQQSEFIRLAVDELHTMGRLEPVQLTLLSEMIKDKEWSAQTLSSLGGSRDWEVRFSRKDLLAIRSRNSLSSKLSRNKKMRTTQDMWSMQ